MLSNARLRDSRTHLRPGTHLRAGGDDRTRVHAGTLRQLRAGLSGQALLTTRHVAATRPQAAFTVISG